MSPSVPPENCVRQPVAESARLNQLAARESLANEICRCTRERETVRAQAQRPKKMQRAARWALGLQAARLPAAESLVAPASPFPAKDAFSSDGNNRNTI